MTAKLSPEQRRLIVEKARAGHSVSELAKTYCVSRQRISGLVKDEIRGYDGWKYSRRKIEEKRKCLHCGKAFKVPVRERKKFCSQGCASKRRSIEHVQGELGRKWEKAYTLRSGGMKWADVAETLDIPVPNAFRVARKHARLNNLAWPIQV